MEYIKLKTPLSILPTWGVWPLQDLSYWKPRTTTKMLKEDPGYRWEYKGLCMYVSHSAVFDSLWTPMGCSPPSFSIHGILQARILEWVTVSFSRWSSWTRDRTRNSCISSRFLSVWATRKDSLIACKCPTSHRNIALNTSLLWQLNSDFLVPLLLHAY